MFYVDNSSSSANPDTSGWDTLGRDRYVLHVLQSHLGQPGHQRLEYVGRDRYGLHVLRGHRGQPGHQRLGYVVGYGNMALTCFTGPAQPIRTPAAGIRHRLRQYDGHHVDTRPCHLSQPGHQRLGYFGRTICPPCFTASSANPDASGWDVSSLRSACFDHALRAQL